MSIKSFENWKNHCPFCGAEMSESPLLCKKCHRAVQRLSVGGVECWVPKKLGEFELKEYVGRGGMGVVFKGYSEKGDPVAIKIAFGNFTKQLENELEILRRASDLNIPNIASLRGVGMETTDSKSFRWIATRWIGPRNLSTIIHDKTVDTKQRIRILENIARGIHYLHENNIIHVDGSQ